MRDRNKGIFVIPSLVIIVAIIGIVVIFYNRNIKKMSREDAKTLAQKVATINNISCEIITESNELTEGQYAVDYKLKDNKMVTKTDYYTIYVDSDENSKIQIDDNEKIAYVYNYYNDEIMAFKEMLCTARKMLDSDGYRYEFVRI